MIHLGDITKINGAAAPVVDCIIGGSPCQDLSIAGKRAGLAGERSGLYMDQIRIIKEMRENDRANGRTGEFIRPRYMVWENVPGAFSSNKGKDFAAVLEEAIRVVEPEAPPVPVPEKGWPTSDCIMGDGWSIAWRVLDAQFWGVPQRRRRIALVADFGGRSAPEILFVRKGVSGDPEPSATEGQGSATGAEKGVDGASYGIDHVITTGGNCTAQGPCVYKDIIPTLKAAGTHAVMSKPQTVYAIGSYHSNAWKSDNPNSGVYETDVAKTLDAINCGHPGCNQGGTCVMAVDTTQITSPTNGSMPEYGKPCHTINANAHVPVVIYRQRGFGDYQKDEIGSACKQRDHKDSTDLVIAAVDCRSGTENPDVNGTLQAKSNGGFSYNLQNVVRASKRVRRLTPLEYERLQGYPDGWTNIGTWVDSKGKKHESSDAARYKALGNSIALPPWKWVLKRLCAQYERDATMASLFDGIGGFPRIWEQLNGQGSCLWASEIEEFPMAVTKLRFGERTTL